MVYIYTTSCCDVKFIYQPCAAQLPVCLLPRDRTLPPPQPCTSGRRAPPPPFSLKIPNPSRRDAAAPLAARVFRLLRRVCPSFRPLRGRAHARQAPVARHL